MKWDIVCFGDINLDYLIGIDSIPKEDQEVPIKNFEFSCGGSAANFSYAASVLENRILLMGSIGNDLNGKFLLDDFQKNKIDTSQIKIEENSPTGTAFVVLDKSKNRRIMTNLGANRKNELKDYDLAILNKSKIFHLSSPDPLIFGDLLEYSKKNNLKISLDPGGILCSQEKHKLLEKIKGIEYLFLNEPECVEIFRTDNIFEIQKILKNNQIKNLIYKKGSKGSIMCDSTSIIEHKGFKVECFDTTGAGDTFAAGFLTAVLEGKKAIEALEYGNAAGALCVTEYGTRKGMNSKKKLEDFILSRRASE